ncbi:hypothetical protein CA235_02425 [Sphingomonas sp. ABOLF]|uniref:hypothetical protein n=1 Tax=Sphingomonas sp. ABOLF TaxID=1985879 RepID=UPI000F7DFF39|nr:hypothetical protein [Sphingomonas sp. ABOLF]RSV17501.1 hypothetical protein CA235_02425 [Sphingomonas sp. ABOLF]
MTDPAATIYAAALARRVAMLAERDAAATSDPAIRAALSDAARVARAEQEAAERAFPAGLDLLDLYRRDALVLANDGTGWNGAVYQAAQTKRKRIRRALVADLLVQAPHRTDDERAMLDLLLSDTLLPEPEAGRPRGKKMHPWHVRVGTAFEYLDETAGAPYGHGENIRCAIAKKRTISTALIELWRTEHKKEIIPAIEQIDEQVRHRAAALVQRQIDRQSHMGRDDRVRLMQDRRVELVDRQLNRLKRLGFGGEASIRRTVRNSER